MNSSILAMLFVLLATIFDAVVARGGYSSRKLRSQNPSRIEVATSLIRYERRYKANAIKYGYNQGYRTTLAALSSGIGYSPVHKQAMITAGSVYIAQSMHPKVYSNGKMLHAESVEKFVICSGHILWDPKTNKATYTRPLTNASVNDIIVPLYKPNISSSSSVLVSYRYFMCPSNLIDNSLDEMDTYCCGPPGYQMCCNQNDFVEQLDITGCSVVLGLTLGIGLPILLIMVCCFVLRMRKFKNLRRSPQTSRTMNAAEFPLQDSNNASGHR